MKYKVQGRIRSAEFIEDPFKDHPKPDDRYIKEGIIYEGKFAKYLMDLCGEDNVYHGAWIRFVDDTRNTMVCQPDVIVLDPYNKKRGYIFECKKSYRREAWSELVKLYRPVVEFMDGKRKWRCIQVCGKLNSAFKRKRLISNMKEVFQMREKYGVLLWQPTK